MFIKGQLQTSFLKPNLPEPDNDIQEASIIEGPLLQDSGSAFKGYAAPASTAEEVKARINQILVMPSTAEASHFIYAYRLKGPGSSIKENFSSDNNHGMGLALLKHLQTKDLQDVMCVVTRDCQPGFRHLGKKRFELMCQTADEALSGME